MTVRERIGLLVGIGASVTVFAVSSGPSTTASERSTSLTPPPAATTPSNVGARLDEAVRTVLPDLPDQIREPLVRRYLESSPSGRAIAVHPPSGVRAIVSDKADAAEYALALCAFRAGHPCALIASGDDVRSPEVSGGWSRDDATLLRYAGLFEPDRVPLVEPETRTRADVMAYRSLKGPKAVALRPDALYIETASNQHAAEWHALEDCHHDPAHGTARCFLYAIGDGVVLPRWHDVPATPAVARADPPAGAYEQIAAIAGLVRSSAAHVIRFDYAKEPGHKAIAIHLPTGFTFRWGNAATAEQAERWTLEGCEIRFDGACVLLAVDQEARASDPRTARPKAMERVSYSGLFRLDRLPIAIERNEDVRNYARLPGERAIAIRPNRALVGVSRGQATRAAAERDALTRCNDPGDDPSPCFVYASGDQVVLPQRRTEVAK
jgi:hypothetical protein